MGLLRSYLPRNDRKFTGVGLFVHSLNKYQILDMRAVALLVVLCASWGIQQVAIKTAIPRLYHKV